jgi:hypothetical protein
VSDAERTVVRTVESIGAGKRIRLATVRKQIPPDARRIIAQPHQFDELVDRSAKLASLVFRDRAGSWWRRRFSDAERARAIIDLNNAVWTIAGPLRAGGDDRLDASVIAPLRDRLREFGVAVLVGVADASIGHLVVDHERLGTYVDELVVVQSGRSADSAIIERAERDAAMIISNDRFREWKRDHAWARRTIERIRVPVAVVTDENGDRRIDLGLAEDELGAP